MNESVTQKTNRIYSFIIPTMSLFLFLFAVKGLSDNHTVSNIILYTGAIVVFLVTYLVSVIVLSRVVLNKVVEKVLIFGTALFCVVWMISAFYKEAVVFPYYPSVYVRHKMPALLYLFILLTSCVFVFSIIRKKSETSKLLRIMFGLLFVIIETLLLYAPNIFADTMGGTYHAEAYINSIVNVLHANPYEYWRTSIYGHYALLYYFPVKLLKLIGVNEWIAITTSIAFFGFVCFLSETILFNKLISNDFIYILTVIANAIVNTQLISGEYYQINPHRILFPAIMLLLSYYYYQSDKAKNEKIFYIILWVISSCSVVWNFETGLICTFICFLVCIYKQCVQAQKIKVSIIGKNFGFATLAGFMAVFSVNVYNRFCGGGWVSIKEYIYPIGNAEFNVEDLLTLPLGNPFMAHFFAMVLLLSVTCYQVLKIFLLKANVNDLMIVLTATLGLGIFTYYMNRVVNSNMSISAFEIILVLSLVLDNNIQIIQNAPINVKKIGLSQALYLIGIVVLTSMCLSTIGCIGTRIKTYYETVYNTDLLNMELLNYENAIREDGSVAFVGKNTTIISSMLDRDKGIYTMDYQDIINWSNGEIVNSQAIDYISSEIATCAWDYLFVHEDSLSYIPVEYYMIWHDRGGYYIYTNKH